MTAIMHLNRTDHIITGVDHHYIRINHYQVVEAKSIFGTSDFILEFLNDTHFTYDYHFEGWQSLNGTNHLPFPFRTEKLETSHFEVSNNFKVSDLLEAFDRSFEEYAHEPSHLSFRKSFINNLSILKNFLRRKEVSDTCVHLTIHGIPCDSPIITQLYNDMGYTVDYFYFGAIFLKYESGFVTFELAYE